jgi:hypothetical protein
MTARPPHWPKDPEIVNCLELTLADEGGEDVKTNRYEGVTVSSQEGRSSDE